MARCTHRLAGRRRVFHRISLLAALPSILLGGLLAVACRPAAVPDRHTGWSEDLDFLRQKIGEIHPSPFTKIDARAFDRELERLRQRLPDLEHHQVTVELATLVARIGDGHTRVTLPLAPGIEFFQGHSKTPPPFIDGLRFRAFPLRFALVGDDLFIRAVSPRHPRLLGARVSRLGTKSAREAIAAVTPTVRRDNDMQLRDLLPSHLVLAEVLEARGVIPTRGELALEVTTRAGETVRETLAVGDGNQDPGKPLLVAGKEATADAPLYLRDTKTPYWFEWLGDSGAVYFQFNQVGSAQGERLDEFSVRLAAELDRRPGAALVIDLRHNPGGWYGTAKQLLRALLRREVADHPGRLLVLIGRTTFSAAMMLALDLERHTDALFLGEPTGSLANHHGDARRVILPNSGLTVRISTLFWQAHPSDERPYIAPHLRIEPSFDDYLAGRDPVLEAALAIASPKTSAESLHGSWQGRCSFPQNDGFVLSLEVGEREGKLWAAISVPGFGVENVELTKLEWDGRHLRGEAPWKGGNVTRFAIDAQVRQGYLVGEAALHADMGTERLPFLLTTSAAP